MTDAYYRQLLLILDRLVGAAKAQHKICAEVLDTGDSRLEESFRYLEQAEKMLAKLERRTP